MHHIHHRGQLADSKVCCRCITSTTEANWLTQKIVKEANRLIQKVGTAEPYPAEGGHRPQPSKWTKATKPNLEKFWKNQRGELFPPGSQPPTASPRQQSFKRRNSMSTKSFKAEKVRAKKPCIKITPKVMRIKKNLKSYSFFRGISKTHGFTRPTKKRPATGA